MSERSQLAATRNSLWRSATSDPLSPRQFAMVALGAEPKGTESGAGGRGTPYDEVVGCFISILPGDSGRLADLIRNSLVVFRYGPPEPSSFSQLRRPVESADEAQ